MPLLRRRRPLESAVLVVLLVAGLLVIYDRLHNIFWPANPPPPVSVRVGGVKPPPPTPPPPPPLPAEPVVVMGAAMKGLPSARVAVIEYSEFQCPWCGRFYRDTLGELTRQYIDAGTVRLYFRHLPLGMHPFAEKAAEAAECAGQSGKFWEMHNANFEHQDALDLPSLFKRAKDLKLDLKTFTACLDGGKTADKIKQDATGANGLGFSGTPGFFFCTILPDGRVKVTQRFSGARPLKDFQTALDTLLAVQVASK